MGQRTATAAIASPRIPRVGWLRPVASAIRGALLIAAVQLCATALSATHQPAFADGRAALIAVATDYEHLRGSGLDVSVFRRLAENLTRQGYKVHETYNERGSFLRAKLTRFATDARDADIAVVILAGHFASNARVTLFLPVEIETETTSDIFLRGIPTRSFLAGAALARSGVVARLATFPALPDRFTSLVSYPRIDAETPPGIALATSGAASSPPAALDEKAAQAARTLDRELKRGDWDVRQFAEAVAAGDPRLIVGDLPPSDEDRQAQERRRRDLENRKRRERERLEAEAAAKEEARIAAAKRDEAEGRATLLKKRAEEEARARAEAERRARETAERLEKLEADFRALQQRELEASRRAEQAKAVAAERKAAEEKAQQAKNQTAAATAAALEAAKREAASREAKLNQQLAALQSRLAEARADANRNATSPPPPAPETTVATTPAPAPPPVTTSPHAPETSKPALQPSTYKLAFLQRMDTLFRPDQRQKIQNRLKAMGFLSAVASSEFDAETRAAIRRYQVATGYEPTGYLTPPQFLKLIAE